MYELGYLAVIIVVLGGIGWFIVQLIKESHVSNSTGTNYNSKSSQDIIKKNNQELLNEIRKIHQEMDERKRQEQDND